MTFLDIFSLFVLLVILLLFVGLLLLLAWFPGHVAKNRRSPWATPINVAEWIGILFPPIWMLALIAAFVPPRAGDLVAVSEVEAAELTATLGRLRERMANVEVGMQELLQAASSRRAGGKA